MKEGRRDTLGKMSISLGDIGEGKRHLHTSPSPDDCRIKSGSGGGNMLYLLTVY